MNCNLNPRIAMTLSKFCIHIWLIWVVSDLQLIMFHPLEPRCLEDFSGSSAQNLMTQMQYFTICDTYTLDSLLLKLCVFEKIMTIFLEIWKRDWLNFCMTNKFWYSKLVFFNCLKELLIYLTKSNHTCMPNTKYIFFVTVKS